MTQSRCAVAARRQLGDNRRGIVKTLDLNLINRVGPSLVALAALAALLLAHVTLNAFPIPWSDEVFFLIPAASLSSGHILSAAGQLNPQGIYWLPSGFYFVYSLTSSLLPLPILEAARLTSLLCTLLSAVFLGLIIRKCLGGTWSVVSIVSLWLLSPPTIMMANIARPEALISAVSFLGIFLAVSDRPVGAIACAIICVFIHPLLAFPVLVAAALIALRTQRWNVHRFDLILATAAIGMVIFELVVFIEHFDRYILDLGFQLHRKSSRRIHLFAVLFGMLSTISILISIVIRSRLNERLSRKIEFVSFALIPLGTGSTFAFVFFFGREMWYWPFLLHGILMIFVGVCMIAAQSKHPNANLARPVLAIASAVIIGAFWIMTLRGGLSGFSIAPDTLDRVSSDRATIDQAVALAVSSRAEGDALVSPFLAHPFLAQLQTADAGIFTFNPLSKFQGKHFRTIVFAEKLYPAIIQDELRTTLTGYRCIRSKRLRSPNGFYIVIVADVLPFRGRYSNCFTPNVDIKLEAGPIPVNVQLPAHQDR
jgi:hypothetical protein